VSERNVVRVGSGLVVALSLLLPLLMRVPERLPAIAMGSTLLMCLERVLAVFFVLLFLVVFLYRGLLRGELPKAISERGAEWQDVVADAAETFDERLDALNERLDALETAARPLP
jgi:hypothetical protein